MEEKPGPKGPATGPEGKEKEAKGQAWSARVVAGEGQEARQDRNGDRGTQGEKGTKEKAGDRSIRSTTNLSCEGGGRRSPTPQLNAD